MVRRTSSLFAIRAPLPKQTAFVLGFVAPALVLGAWCAITYGGLVQPDFLPSPTEVVRGTLQLFIQYDLGTRHPDLDAGASRSRSCSRRRWRCRSAC